ncbi:uncharacterized protein [Solanum lycopersicum]|uniref:uncharacterized protein n=1 Tax=Solanum lycopersicum TaxID=4081 RepID=UPI0037488524
MNKQSMKEEIMKAMKELHYTPDVMGLNYEDLCIHPNFDLPDGFKVPKFDTFRRTRNPLSHLRAYCDQLVGVGKNVALLMWLFSRSLNGEALEWFASQDMKQWSTWNSLSYRWRKEASRVQPPVSKKETQKYVCIEEPEYYDRMMLLIGAKYAEIVKVGETIEDGLKIGKISHVASQAGSSGLLRKKREDVSFISHVSDGRTKRSFEFGRAK